VTPDERIARLQHGVKQLLDDVRNLPDEALYRDPPDGEWSIMRNLAHVAEMLPYWAHQAEAMMRSPGKPFGRTHDDPVRIATIEEHSNDVLEVMLASIQASADECVSALRALPVDAWSKEGEHPSRGVMTVEQMVDAFIVGHVAAHVRQVEEALEAVEANPSG
jgi:uncharacterized damage-inducible protein DinB